MTVAVEEQHEPQNIPRAPWRVDTTEAGHFVIKDATGFALAYVYARSDPALQDRLLAEVLVIAKAIAELCINRRISVA